MNVLITSAASELAQGLAAALSGKHRVRLGLEVDLDRLPSRCEVFNILTDTPHGRFSNEKARRILGFAPGDRFEQAWRSKCRGKSCMNR